MAAKFELYKDRGGQFRWRLRHENGNVIADSGEGYTTKANALNGIESVKTNCLAADVKEQEAAKPARKPARAPKKAEKPAVVAEPVKAEEPVVVAEPVKARRETPKGKAVLNRLTLIAIPLLIIFGILLILDVGPFNVWVWVESILGVFTAGIGLGHLIYRMYW